MLSCTNIHIYIYNITNDFSSVMFNLIHKERKKHSTNQNKTIFWKINRSMRQMEAFLLLNVSVV